MAFIFVQNYKQGSLGHALLNIEDGFDFYFFGEM